MDADRGKWALRTLLEAIKGPYPDRIGFQASESDQGLTAWYRLNFYMAREYNRQDLNAQMSLEQRESYRLLHEWWTAAYQDPAYSLAAILDYTSSFGDYSQTNPVSEGQAEENWGLIFRHLRLKCWPDGPIPEPEFTGKLWHPSESYNVLMESLFRLEFTAGLDVYPRAMDAEPPDITHYRQYFREQGVKYAYCQELGYKLYSLAHPPHDLPEKGPSPGPDSAGSAHPLLTRGPVFNPCPWLAKSKATSLDNLPLYLWDVTNAETVVATSLTNRPEYTAISHTWGRWIQDEGNPTPVSGARWLVPRNTRFSVTELPELLRRVPCGTRYVWLDLLCIPQHACAEQAREIGRQAKIFESATHVVAWLNDMEDFEGLRLVTQWQALKLLGFHDARREERCRALVDEVGRKAGGKQTGLMAPGLAVRRKLNPWFTSLWTLQEAAMRPDMWLCSRDWRPLTWDGCSPLPLSGFVAVLDVFKTSAVLSRDTGTTIGTYQQLDRWSIQSGLERLLDLDRTSLITLGDRRECTGRRAEAIMSALGATDWYEEALRDGGGSSSDGRVADLVLGKYPRRFVQECASKFPGEFFGSTVKVKLDDKPDLSTEAYGTLLPFSRGNAYQMDAIVSRDTRFPMDPHESLRSWVVLDSGAVKVRRACILSRSQAGRTITARVAHSIARLCARLPHSSKASAYPLQEEDLEIYDSLDELQTQLREEKVELYAILTEFHFIRINEQRSLVGMGIVLERSQLGRLRKKHHFWLCDQLRMVDVSKSEQVDWVVD